MTAASTAARLTLGEVADFLIAWRARVEAGDREIDLADYVVVDSSALAALLELNRLAAPQRLQFINPSDNLRKLAELYGVSDLLF